MGDSDFEKYKNYVTENLEVLVNAKIGYFDIGNDGVKKVPHLYLERKGFFDTHFSVDVPYAGKKLCWEVIFDPDNLLEVPDFNFNDNTFLAEPDINFIAENVPSWDNWNLINPNALLNILTEFVQVFKKCQVQKLKENMYAHIRQEYEDLLKIKDIREENVEVYVENRNSNDILDNECNCITFLIYLPIDFSDLPEFYQEELQQEGLLNPGEDFAFLQIQMKKLDRSQNRFALQLSPRADQTLGKLKLPKYSKDATLSGYVLCLQRCIEAQIKQIQDQHRLKNLFISTVVNTFSDSIIEYNNRLYNKVVFIFDEFEEYACMVTITLSLKFPQERPKVQLSSIYCQAGKMCNSFLNFDYFSTFTVDDVVESIISALKEEMSTFQNHRHYGYFA